MSGLGGESEVFAPGLLSGRVALVTGGGTGLGKATAFELARCGAAVTIAGRRADVLEGAVSEIGAAIGVGADETDRAGGADGGDRAVATGATAGADRAGSTGRVDWIAGDVREPSDAERLVRTVLERHGRMDLLVNNAGGQYFTPAELIAGKGWRAVWRLNVDGMLNMAEAAFALAFGPADGGAQQVGAETPTGVGTQTGARVPTGGGTIVNVTLSPHHGMPGMAHSGAARATVEALTRELAHRWAVEGVAVTAVAAGHFDTEALEKYPQTLRAGMARSVPLQRLGAVQEHAWLVALLASPLGRAFSGSTVTLDGARDNWFGPWPPPGLADESGEVPAEERKGSRSPG
jgi:citronellol/citronellal dehydrogenase